MGTSEGARPNRNYRALLGWICEFVNRPLPGPWPQVPIDDETIGDLETTFRQCAESGYTHVALWGFFVDRNWPVDIRSCCDADRRRRIRRVVDIAHAMDLRLIAGVGLYSWGFEEIIRANPQLSRGNFQAMCPSVSESHEFMRRVIDFVMDDFGFDGLNMQSADQGRCQCDHCLRASNVEYHAQLYARVAGWARERRADAFLVVDNWGCPISSPADVEPLVELSSFVDAIIDTDNSAGHIAPGFRSELAKRLNCPLGTLAGKSIWTPQWWTKDRFFIPTSLTNAAYLRSLAADGCTAVEQFVATPTNPSGEISIRYSGLQTARPDADPIEILREAVETTYHPLRSYALDVLVDVVAEAERRYFENCNRPDLPEVGLSFVDEGFLSTSEIKSATYLTDMTPAGRRRYTNALTRLIPRLEGVRLAVERKASLDMTLACLRNTLAEIDQIERSDAERL